MLRALGLRKTESSASLRPPTNQQNGRNGSSDSTDSKNVELILQEFHDFELTLKAMDYVLDDQASKGIELMSQAAKKDKEPIFVLGLGVIQFIEATLGFESETMKLAQNTLNEAENLSYKKKVAHEKAQLKTSTIYPPGTQYAVTYAEANLLNALIMLLSESVIESAKALYKLRKAYYTLDEINKSINSHQAKHRQTGTNSAAALLKKNVSTPNLSANYLSDSRSTLGSISDISLTNNSSRTVITSYDINNDGSSSLGEQDKEIIFKHIPVNLSSKQKKDIKILKLAEKIYQLKKSRIIGSNIGNTPAVNRQRVDIGFDSDSESSLVPKSADLSDSEVSVAPPAPAVSENQHSHPSVMVTLDNDANDSTDDFVDAEEDITDDSQPINGGFENLKIHNGTQRQQNQQQQQHAENFSTKSAEDIKRKLIESIHADILSKADTLTVDEFIHSGVNLCFGILQVVLSLIPPTIGKVLSIVGFKGSRENGLKMLWRATTERNIHGGIATLGLLVFYDGPFQFTDTDFDVPSTENNNDNKLSAKSSVNDIQKLESRAFSQEGEATLLHPGKKLELALLKARAYFPNSVLWLLQEGRMLASQGKLTEAVTLMDSATDGSYKKIEMKQAEALLVFDKAMILVYLHRYETAAEHFLRLIELNSWSHALYTYIAGSCYLEGYRMCRIGVFELSATDPCKTIAEKEKFFKDKARHYLLKAPSYLQGAKKGFFQSKQMPMDRYLLRKLHGIKKTQEKNPELDFVDCVGTSLVHELSYFWNAYNRMDDANLKLSLKLLGYSGALNAEHSLNTSVSTNSAKRQNYSYIKETEQESMLRYFLQSLTLRRLGRIPEGIRLIDNYVIKDKILIYDTTTVAGSGGAQSHPGSGLISIKSNKSTSVDSVTSANVSNKSLNGSMISRYHKRSEDPWLYPTALYERAIFCWKVLGLQGTTEVKDWLKKAINYADDYELSARTGMRIKAAMDRLEGY